MPEEIEMIDRILEWFCMPPDATKNVPIIVMRNSISYELLKKVVHQEFRHLRKGEFYEYFPAMIKKLSDDKFIEPAYNAELHPNDRMLTISFNGIIFSKQGGYRGRILENNQAERRVQIAQNLQYTLAVGVSTPFAWYLLDLVKIYQNSYFDLGKIFVLALACACLGASLWYILPLIWKEEKE